MTARAARASIVLAALIAAMRSLAFAAGDAEDAVTIARKMVAEGDLPGAVKSLSTFVDRHPQAIAAERYLGDLYYREHDFVAAEKTYRHVLVIAPNDLDTHNRLGGMYAAQDRVREAIAEFTASLPTASAYDNLVELHERSHDLPAFLEQLRHDAERNPLDAGAQYAVGTALRAAGTPEAAQRYLERAAVLAPRSCAVLSELGSTYLDEKRVDVAISVLERCLAVDANYYSSLVNIAVAEIDRDRYEAARAYLDRATRVQPDGSEALVDLGYLADVGGDQTGAIALYERAIAIDPLQRVAYVNLGYDYLERGLYALAEAAFLKGLSISPDDGRLQYLLGRTYAKQGKTALARDAFRRAAVSISPEVKQAALEELSASAVH